MSYTASYIVNSSSAQGTTDFQFTFPYIKEEHIEVFLNYNKITQGSGSNQFQVITNVSPKLIRLNTGIASANLRVEVRRNSSLGTPLVDYADGSTLTANDLDTSALQSLYIDQELKDNQGKTVSVDEATGLPSMGESGTNLRLTNVADPPAAQDAAKKEIIVAKTMITNLSQSPQNQDKEIINQNSEEKIKELNNKIDFYKSIFKTHSNSVILNMSIKKRNGKPVWVDHVRDNREYLLSLDSDKDIIEWLKPIKCER